MDLLLHTDIFRLFFERSHHLIKEDEADLLVYNIFNNKRTRIFLDSTIEKYCFEHFGQTQQQKSHLRQTFKYLMDKRRVIRQNSKEIEIDAHFIELAQNYKGNCLIPILKSDISKITAVISDTIILEKAAKPNIHWCKVQLAAHNTFSVRYIDFQDGEKVLDFFNEVFSLTLKIKEVLIFDRYFNIDKHCNFAYIEKNNLPIKWYSWNLDNPDKERITPQKWNDLVASLNENITFYTTPHKSHIHERKILFENFILETDEDFSKINLQTKTWKIDVTYDSELYKDLLQKTLNFTRFNL